MSQLKCVGVLLSVAGAVWVEFFAAISDRTAAVAAEVAVGGTGTGTGADMWEAGASGGDGDVARGGWEWVGSLVLLWQVCACVWGGGGMCVWEGVSVCVLASRRCRAVCVWGGGGDLPHLLSLLSL